MVSQLNLIALIRKSKENKLSLANKDAQSAGSWGRLLEHENLIEEKQWKEKMAIILIYGHSLWAHTHTHTDAGTVDTDSRVRTKTEWVVFRYFGRDPYSHIKQ